MSEDYDLQRAISCPGCESSNHLAISGSYLGFQVACSECYDGKESPVGFGATVAEAVDAWNIGAKAVQS